MLVAEITTRAQSLSERMKAFEDMMGQWHQQAHELAMEVQKQRSMQTQQALQAQEAQAAGAMAAPQAQPQNQPGFVSAGPA